MTVIADRKDFYKCIRFCKSCGKKFVVEHKLRKFCDNCKYKSDEK